MNRCRRADDAPRAGRRYVLSVRWTRRPAGADSDLGAALDIGLAIMAAALTALVVWGPPGSIGTVIAGPPWLRAVLPLLIGAPLAWRRRAPLLMWTGLWAAITLQALLTLKAPAGLDLMFPLFVGGYSVAAHSPRRRALAGLAIMIPGSVTYVLTSQGVRRGLFVIPPHGAFVTGQSRDSSLFFVGEILACWMLGAFVRGRRDEAALAARNAALERQAEQAVAAERARIARELHDIVAHHLSVVVLQAAGALASGKPADGALRKIERSGREALTEMRRLLSVLREPREETGLSPQPGVGELPALAESVRAVGLSVDLLIDSNHGPIPAAVDVSAYRIVQEALTNVLKHAGPAHAAVAVGCADGAVTIEVTDDGEGVPASGAQTGGHGLTGMRERVAIFGGELRAGPRPGGGYAVRARLPLGEVPSPGSAP
jgi:signal transduction histidine kinase